MNTISTQPRISIGGTDAMKIMNGQWLELYNVKMGHSNREDLSDNFAVQLGIASEAIHREFFQKRSGLITFQPMLPIYSNEYPWMHATLDGLVPAEDTFVELKHTHAAATLREKAVYYLPQLAHYAHVMRTTHCYFSIIKGNSDPDFGRVDIPVEYTEQLINMERAFYWHIENNIPPEATPVISQELAAKTAKVISIGGLKPYDMTESNEWADAAVTWLTTRAEAKANAERAKQLKEMMPFDASEATGHGIVITRNKAGALALRAAKE
jgi:DNA replication initiation complex subunit (GINS family)